jgi:hypothetical protein
MVIAAIKVLAFTGKKDVQPVAQAATVCTMHWNGQHRAWVYQEPKITSLKVCNVEFEQYIG